MREEAWFLLENIAAVHLQVVERLRDNATSLESFPVCRCRARGLSSLCARLLSLQSRRSATLRLTLGFLSIARGGDDAVLEGLIGKAPKEVFLCAMEARGSDALECLLIDQPRYVWKIVEDYGLTSFILRLCRTLFCQPVPVESRALRLYLWIPL